MLKDYTMEELQLEVIRRKEDAFISDTFCIEGHTFSKIRNEKIVFFREYTMDRAYADAVKKLDKIMLRNGATLDLTVTPMKEAQRKEKESISWFIRACVEQGVNSVLDLKPLD